MMSEVTIYINPIGKPRMTRRDRWAERPCVLRYWEYCEKLREETEHLDLTGVSMLSWHAYIAMPKSWSKKKKQEMSGQPHRQKPDRDNIDKGILDALFKDDSGIYYGTIMKLWDDGNGERIELFFE